jgi:hypothetical protein
MAEAYSRLYHRFKREFPGIYADDAALASWIRLLMLADASWPMRPPLPRSVRATALRKLVEAGLVVVEGDSYGIRGLDAERTRRRDAARTGAAKRWQSDGNANASAVAMPRRDETSTSKEETLEIPPPPAERGRRINGTNPRSEGTAPRDNRANPRANGTSTRQVREQRKHGTTRLGSVLREAAARAPEPEDDDLLGLNGATKAAS